MSTRISLARRVIAALLTKVSMTDPISRLDAGTREVVKLYRRTRGLTLIGLWAFAPPVFIQSDGNGGLSFSIGASAGQYELVSRNCAGDFVSSRPVPYRMGGALVEFEPSDGPFRVSGFVGTTSLSGEPFDVGGPYTGALLAYEGSWLGLGAGPVRVSGNKVFPSLYLRLGDRDGQFFQTDVFAPSPFPGAAGLIRGGVGFRRDRMSGFFGLSTGHALDFKEGSTDNGGPFVELKLPLGPRLDAMIAGSWFPGEEHSEWGAGVGLRYHPGSER